MPQEITEELVRYTENFLVQDIKEYLAKDYPKIDGIPIQYFSFKNHDFFSTSFSPLFDREQHFDLYQMLHILNFQGKPLPKSCAAFCVGSAIRISSTIGKREHYDRIIEIVKDSFVLQFIDNAAASNSRLIFNLCFDHYCQVTILNIFRINIFDILSVTVKSYCRHSCRKLSVRISSHQKKLSKGIPFPTLEISKLKFVSHSSSLQWTDNNNFSFTGILQEIKQGYYIMIFKELQN